MATRSFSKRTHRNAARFHKWLALFVGAQALLWLATGTIMAFLPIEKVRGEHVVAQRPERLVPGDWQPAWLGGADDVTALSYRSLLGSTVIEVAWDGGGRTLHDRRTGVQLSPLSETRARAIALSAWTGGDTRIARAELVKAAVSSEYRGPFPAWQVTFADGNGTRVYVDASNGLVRAVRSDTWRFFDFVWGLHIMDWTMRERINSWWLVAFGAGGTVLAVTGLVLLVHRFRVKR